LLICLGSQTYSQTELLTLLKAPFCGNTSLLLSNQLIATMLNLANGADPTSISATTITAADHLISGSTGKLLYHDHVPPSSTPGQAMVHDARVLKGRGRSRTLGQAQGEHNDRAACTVPTPRVSQLTSMAMTGSARCSCYRWNFQRDGIADRLTAQR